MVEDAKIGISARSSDDEVDMSIRRRGTQVDLNKTLNIILKDLEGSSGGGHPDAAGASLDINDFPTFLQILAKHVEMQN